MAAGRGAMLTCLLALAASLGGCANSGPQVGEPMDPIRFSYRADVDGSKGVIEVYPNIVWEGPVYIWIIADGAAHAESLVDVVAPADPDLKHTYRFDWPRESQVWIYVTSNRCLGSGASARTSIERSLWGTKPFTGDAPLAVAFHQQTGKLLVHPTIHGNYTFQFADGSDLHLVDAKPRQPCIVDAPNHNVENVRIDGEAHPFLRA